MNIQRRKYLEDENSLTAFHEAGHAAMFWFFQQQFYLKGISMAPTEDHWGCVMQSSITPPFTLSHLAILNPQRALRVAMMEAMHCLSGPYAESRFGLDDGSSEDLFWLESLYEELGLDDSLREMAERNFGTDLATAARIGFELYEDESKVFRFIRKCSEWTVLSFSFGRMDSVVKELAKVLIDLRASEKEILDGPSTWACMEDAWDSRKKPLQDPSWRRRFSILKGESWYR